MPLLNIRTYPDDVLKQKSEAVASVGEAERQLARDMIETMFENKGVGLAAPQVGVLKQIIVCAPKSSPDEVYVFYNPKITERSGEVSDTEGCLSIPCASGDVTRAKKITVEALDENGTSVTFEAKDFFARIIQHETDHLSGTLFIDHLGFAARKEAIDCAIRVKKL
jgi:peptide deformylase